MSLLLETLIGKHTHYHNGKCQKHISNLMTILHSLQINIVGGLQVRILVYAPPYQRQHRVPCSSTKSGKDQEPTYVHTCQSCRDADKLTHSRNQSAKECGSGTVVAEELFCLLHLCPVDKAHMTQSAVGKAVNNRSAQPLANNITNTNDIPLSGSMAFHAAGGTTTSDGKGMKLLSIAIKTTTTQ